MVGKLAVVFGGSGFVGRNVVRELAKRGWRVRVAVRRPHHALFLRPMGAVGQIQLVQANIRHRPSVEQALNGADAVINLVSVLHQTGAQNFKALNARGAATIAELAAKSGARALVHVSALGAALDSDSLSARSKAEGEAAVRAAFPTATILRPSIIFGPEDDFFNRFAAMAAMAPFVALPAFGGGATRFQPVYVDDVADAILAAIERPDAAGRLYELGGPRVYSFRELMEMILAIIARPRLILPIPFALGPAIGMFGEALGLAPFLDPPITRDQIRQLRKDNVVGESGRANVGRIEDLGVQPRALDAILPTYLYRYRKYGQFAERTA